ncbi:hypothetical protein [Reinekea sp.]|jgi:hypothetical protein|uniref:hypothetical protein n=1 Tax=Reinekea sp. TaxID=1970455 RepID=UPI002A835D3D|nr:hypothetical protein [Reinekea sp.]
MCRHAHYLLAILLAVPLIGVANPMRPDPVAAPSGSASSGPVAAPRSPRLTGIVIIGDWQRAIFSGQRERKIGDRIAGFTLMAISATSVVLKRGGQTIQLTLQSSGEVLISPAQED